MDHGIEAYFRECRRNVRRIASLSALLGLASLSILVVARVPSVHRVLYESPLLRAGFAGPPRYVERVRIATGPGTEASALRDVGHIVMRRSRDEGIGTPVTSLEGPRRGSAARSSNLSGPSAQGGEVRIRADVSRTGGAVFQSEELVIEHMVLPDYPEEVWGKGIAGRVTVYARIDSLGHVDDVDVTRGLHPLVDQAVRTAVLQYRFRPYHEGGHAVPLHVRLTFRFTI